MTFVQNSKLSELSHHLLPELQAKFKVNWPEHIVAHNLLQSAINTNNNEESNPIRFYTFKDSWKENGTFIATLVSVYTCDEKT